MAFHDQFLPQRTSSEIVLYLSSKQPAPGVPFELQGAIAPDVWSNRLPILTRLSERYSKPMFERIWIVVGFLATFIVPVALYNVLLKALHAPTDDDIRHSDGFFNPTPFAEARAIGGGISLGIALLFAGPLIVWKFIGRRQMNQLLARWEKSDRSLINNSGPIPTWKVRMPGIFSDNTILTITLPSPPSPTSFHVNAYLPSYINPPPDANDAYYYPYKPEPGLPRMSVVGTVPGGTLPRYLDEKHEYQDVKV